MREQGLGWLLVVLAAVVWPSAFLHDATTVHAVCPEHGELLDVEVAHAIPDVAHPEDAHEEPGVRDVALSTATEEGGQHELCPFVILGQPASSTHDAPRGRALTEGAVALVQAASEVRFQSVPILSLAPKQSPPAIA